ncbi:MAG: transglycosylase domain-containing protein [Actinomycetota bacterium]
MRTGNRKLALILVLCLSATGCGGTAPIDEKRLQPKTESTKILAADGSTITTLKQEENREAVPLKRIPKHVRNAVIAIEDVRFYTHRGIDLKAIVRALVADAKSGKIVQGGSTITQQLVRSALSEVGRESTIRRKLREAVFAYRVDSGYSKAKILELYLNTVYFGEGAYGVQTASRHFFGKDVEDLGLAEAALLAGMIRSPVAYSPRTNGNAALQRRNLVLERMRLARLAKPGEVNRARLAPLVIPEQKQERYPAAFFVDYVTRLIQRSDEFAALGSSEQERGDLLFRRGLRVHTTLDPKMQRHAETAIGKVLDRPGDPSASLVALDPKNGFVRALVGGKDYFAGADADPCALIGFLK